MVAKIPSFSHLFPFPFHLSLPVESLAVAEKFYVEVLGGRVGRRAENWVDVDLYGHQLSFHLAAKPGTGGPSTATTFSEVDGKKVPVPHFGVILDMETWKALAERLAAAGMEFVIAPYLRFAGQVGEQGTLFFYDPCGYALEFKGFADLKTQIFATA